ncbi:MAG: hypothetical protein ORN54_09845, partial [Cyclobacteriaceae bacterium]|nr:hypothetical protein [Cyclobacteriaceae bacterium]
DRNCLNSDPLKYTRNNSVSVSKGDSENNTFNGFRDRYWIKRQPPSSIYQPEENVMLGAKVRYYQEP